MKKLSVLAIYGQYMTAWSAFTKTIALLLLFSWQPAVAKDTVLDPSVTGFQTFYELYEPSGVIQLKDLSLLFIEDEQSRPFVRLTPQPQPSNRFDVQLLDRQSSFKTLLTGASGPLNDLEGITQGAENHLYAITSHSRQNNGSRDASRERLVRLQVTANKIESITIRKDLRNALVEAYPVLEPSANERRVKDHAGLNIEGLTVNRSNDALWIGFRAPLIDGKAIVVTVENPDSVFSAGSNYEFSENLQFLDLNGGGIRDIAFDPTLDGYVIASQREGTKKEKSFKLWFWSGIETDTPRRIKISGIKNIRRTEGIAPITLGAEKYLLLVSDEGDVKRLKNAQYSLVKYNDLNID